MRPEFRTGSTLAVATIAAVLAGCLAEAPTNIPNPPTPLPQTPFVVSGPVPQSQPSVGPAATGPETSSTTVWISLPVGSLPEANSVTITVLRTGAQVSAIVTDGGFDPVWVVADVGDTLAAIVTDASAGEQVRYLMLVPANSVPVVVRSSPPPHKRDVPLNAIMIVTFSEPMDSGSLMHGVTLRTDTSAVSGTVTTLYGQGAILRALFTPGAALAPRTHYLLLVGTGARDVQGDSLRTAVSVDFTTDTAASLPDSTPQPPPVPAAPSVTILGPVAGDTVPVNFPHLRFTLWDSSFIDEVAILLDDLHGGPLQQAVAVNATIAGDSVRAWNYWGAGSSLSATGTFGIVVQATDILGRTGSSAARTVVVVNPDTAPRILIRSFSVVEYQDPSDSLWTYAPQLVVSDAPGQTGLQAVGFELLDVPGLGVGGGASAVGYAIPPDSDTPLFGAIYGDFPLTFDWGLGRRSTGGTTTARLTYRDNAQHYYVVTIQGPIVSGGTPSPEGPACAHWTAGFMQDSPNPACPASLRVVAGASATAGVHAVSPAYPRQARIHGATR